MRSRLSLRGWLLLASMFFAVLVVGGIALTTYVIVSDGMSAVVLDTTERVSTAAAEVFREAAAAARDAAPDDTGARDADFVRGLPGIFDGAGLDMADFALYDVGGRPLWLSSAAAIHPESAEARERAVRTGVEQRSREPGGDILSGLFSEADLKRTIVHLPVVLPSGAPAVLDVTYLPMTEERVIDAVRVPMAILAVSAMLIMVVLMQTSMAWVLNLVDDLRRAADSIDAGRLDERLPEAGENEIGELAHSINRLIDRLQRQSEAQARFVADASHELATPVAGIRGYTNILRAWGGEDEAVRAEAVDAIDRESRRMTRLTSDLLNLLHADQGLRLKSERFDLNKLARDQIVMVANRHIGAEIEFEGPRSDSLVMVGDPDRTEDVLSILLDNATKYTPAGGRVRLSTSRRREEIQIEVSDTGKGITPDELPRIFDRFFRSEQARASGEAGFGLGLAIAKSIVTGMGGDITATSEVGQGTTFTIVLPRGR